MVVSLAVVALAAFHVNWQLAASATQSIRWPWLIGALSVFLGTHIIVAWRFYKLLNLDGHFASLCGLTNLHSMFNYLLPAKLGELSFPMMTSQRLGVPVSQSGAGLALARLLDLGIIAVLLPVVLVPLQTRLPAWIVNASIVYCGVILMLWIGGLWWLKQSAMQSQDSNSVAEVGTIRRHWRDAITHLQRVSDNGHYAELWLLTVCIWMGTFFYLYLIVTALGFTASFLQMAVTSIFLVPLTVLPVQGFANIGTHEAAWVSAFVLFGATAEDALTIAVLTHLVLFCFVLVLGLIGVTLARNPSRSAVR